MNEVNELKPCPFCGGEAVIKIDLDIPGLTAQRQKRRANPKRAKDKDRLFRLRKKARRATAK